MPELPFEKSVPFIFEGKDYDAVEIIEGYRNSFHHYDMVILKSSIGLKSLPDTISAAVGITFEDGSDMTFSSSFPMPQNVKDAHAKMAAEVRFWWLPSRKRVHLEAFRASLYEMVGERMAILKTEAERRRALFLTIAAQVLERTRYRRHTEEARIRNFERAQLTRRLLGKRASRGIAPHRRRFAI